MQLRLVLLIHFGVKVPARQFVHQQEACHPHENAIQAGCYHDALCGIRVGNHFTCACTPRWHGARCEIPNKKCETNPCENGGECFPMNANTFTCTCKAGFTGATCADLSNCANMPCLNQATCVPTRVDFECTCLDFYSGKRCEGHHVTLIKCSLLARFFYGFTFVTMATVVPICTEDPCHHGMACVQDQNEQEEFRCECKYGYMGKLCDQGAFHPCAEKPCPLDNMVCIEKDLLSDPPYECTCPYGHMGPTCTQILNACIGKPCLNGGTCTVVHVEISCECPPNARGEFCEISGTDEWSASYDSYEIYEDLPAMQPPLAPGELSMATKIILITAGVVLGLFLLTVIALLIRRKFRKTLVPTEGEAEALSRYMTAVRRRTTIAMTPQDLPRQ